ncbi:SGNH/GDSL hydrolase family protein [Yinghuangia seranimata]|uniref:SGNH/GDSL hydrolase family protein n=1 Tax=Yinghuangia seranimata TaxID=408067 RepID=UPI00248B8D7C|nr:SGNH/GDSL hydrolase family protein [Yinghuangia seranimata]MDI2128776.1 SGNH/GDSL hydrolase family protein [Yinghuangia seranimata]
MADDANLDASLSLSSISAAPDAPASASTVPGATFPDVPGLDAVHSYVAIGDSFTEGVGDPGPDGSLIGWADRFAVRLAEARPGLRYANLAVRGKLLHQILDEQLPLALAARPDLVSFCAGGNDVLRPGGDPDKLAAEYEQAVADLRAAGARVMVFTGFDTRELGLLKLLRGKVATYNEHLRVIAARYDCTVVDLWAMHAVQDRRAWSEDRLHLSACGHERVAQHAARSLGVPTAEDPEAAWPPEEEQLSAADARREHVQWAREHLVPWIGRRLRGQSSGDGLEPKRPDLLPL